ncbi:folate family ECF transporter S component [Lacticaseibacillus jixiensis]|uniref:folate family ECF transporter S component n=1 Tax=Lacticaseibacillus jixiensis TaxID=3231926 RepID=UPI0036F27F10
MQVLSFSSAKFTTKTVVSLGLFMALELVLSRFSISNSFLRIGPAFIATVMMAYYLGPWVAAIGAGLCDQLNVLVFMPGLDFPGFTVTAVVAAIIYGIFFYQQPVRFWRVLVATVLVVAICDTFLNTMWLDMMGMPWQGIIIPRILKNLVMLVIEVGVSYAVLKAVSKAKPQL